MTPDAATLPTARDDALLLADALQSGFAAQRGASQRKRRAVAVPPR